MSERSYEFDPNPVPAMRWDEYARIAENEYATLLAGNPFEAELQRFFEQNPSFLPGAWTVDIDSGHAPYPDAVISQPKLNGLTCRQPDFMWLATESGRWYPTLIEIERPSKLVFKKNKCEQSMDFAQAASQLAQWRAWFNETANLHVFEEYYGVPPRLRDREMAARFVLIYGRRAEYSEDRERQRIRTNLLPATDTRMMSFDSLTPNPKSWNLCTVRATGNRRFRCVAVPPTWKVGYHSAECLGSVDAIEEVIDGQTRMSDSRREFLKRRLRYWQAWRQPRPAQTGPARFHLVGGDKGWE